MTPSRTPWLLVAAFGLIAIIFLPGLWGGFLLDDWPNLRVLRRWLDGMVLWQEVVFGNDSGPLGRSLSMATFLANAAVGGLSPLGYKIVNLAIHLTCMGLAMGFLRALLRRDPQLGQQAAMAALLIAVWWAVLPIHAATVFYIVQRMAQLSTLFLFGGLWLFVHARERLESGRPGGAWLLWLGVPATTILGAFAKENALLLPLLCAVVEFCYFTNGRRPAVVRWFFALTVLLPAGALLAILLLTPESILGGYARRDFGPMERVMTQTRVLWSYVSNILLPFGPRLGLFHDDYVLSTGLFRPVTTFVSMLAWAAVLGAAWRLRHTAPAVLAGLLLFLAGHAMESSIFPLEMIFLHRNYMPALGLLLSVTGSAVYCFRRLGDTTKAFRRVSTALLAGVLLAYCLSTFARAWIWQSELSLYAQELETNPDSVRTRTAVATLALERGHPSAALAQIEALESVAGPEHEPAILVWKMLIVHCQGVGGNRTSLLEDLGSRAPKRIHPYTAHAMGIIATQMATNRCTNLEPGALADVLLDWLERTDQPDSSRYVVGLRYNTARLLAVADRHEEALTQVLQAWRDDGKRQFPIGVMAFDLAARLERYQLCRAVLADLKRLSDGYDLREVGVIEGFEEYLLEAEST